MKSRVTLLTALLLASLTPCHGEEAAPREPTNFSTGLSARQRILLDAGWRFHRGEIPGLTLGASGTPVTAWRWTADERARSDAEKMAAPDLDTSGGNWKEAKTGDDTFRGRVGFSWYRTTLPNVSRVIPSLHFESVDDNARVYLNGKRLTSHEGWDDPFDVDLTPAWKADGSNVLAVLVENTAGMGGIIGPVSLQTERGYKADGPALPAFNDRDWRPVHLPHDFVVEGTFDEHADRNHGYLRATNAWYRKTFEIPATEKGKSLWIDFDGVYRDSKVWLNGHYLGQHKSGYTSFRFDISKVANCGGENVLAVYVDARHFEGWWYEGGGIYRRVWLNAADPLHVAPWGTFVTSSLPEPGAGRNVSPAKVQIETTLANDGSSSADATLVSRVMDDHDHVVATASMPVSVPANVRKDFTQRVTVEKPELWSIETPRMYHLVSTIERNGQPVDSVRTPFGIRTIRFDANTGFFLNGKPVKIQGVCNHQDFAGLGIAVPDALEYWRVKKMKEMGANGWRMSHNPPTPSLLDACDELGTVVMDENRHLGDSEGNLAEVANMVQRDRNHPSIIMWSMCNEQPAAGTKEGGDIFAAMKATVLKYDPTRPVTSANNSGWFGKGFTYVEDLMGVNYNTQVYDAFHKEHPRMPLFASETASTTTTRGEYANDSAKALVSSYQMTDDSWAPVAERPFVAGSFVWTGFDYKGEPTPCNWPSINSHFGILDMCGFPKDNYYYYLSWWKTKPIVHLLPHWTWPGKEGQNIRVIALSNCQRVELFLNGRSLGAKEMPRNGHLDWEVQYEPGTLLAKGYDATGKVTATDSNETTGAPASLRLKTDRAGLTADGEDVTPVEVDVLDAQGRIVPTADNIVMFKVSGAGHVAGVGNGNPGDHDPDKSDYRHAFHGKCLVVVGADEKPGAIELTATSPGLLPASLPLSASAGHLRVEYPSAVQSAEAKKVDVPFILGADISWVQEQEDEGIRFSDRGAHKDIFAILRDRKLNWIRLRIFNDPKADNGYSKKGYCDLEHTLQMARRIKAAEMKFLLDFHYSDTWADPAHQIKPSAWQGLHGKELENAVETYTREVVAALKRQGTGPDMVQIGNEISNGFMWPDGQVWKSKDWDTFCGLLKAGIRGAKQADPSVKIMLHLAWGGQNTQSRAFMDKVLSKGVEFDVLGQSYYPRWQRTLDDLKANLTDLAGRYKQDIIVVEYAAPHIREINDIVHGLPGGKGCGTFFWEPTKGGPGGPGVFEGNGTTKPEIDIYPELATQYGK